MSEREIDRDFLHRIADFLEAHGRDEGGFSDATRQAFAADAERLRRIARRYRASSRLAGRESLRGRAVLVTLPDKPPRSGVVAQDSTHEDRVNVRYDGQRKTEVVHRKFVQFIDGSAVSCGTTDGLYECGLAPGHTGPHACICGCGREWTSAPRAATTEGGRE